MYDELIKMLRICASSGSCEACPNCADGKCKSNGVFGGWDGLFHDAADAIEQLVDERGKMRDQLILNICSHCDSHIAGCEGCPIIKDINEVFDEQ